MKAYRPGKKCSIYIKKMISKGSWKVNERLPSISKIALTLNVSAPTVRNALKEFEFKGMVESWGSLGFYLVSNLLEKRNVTKHWIGRALASLNSYEALSSGGRRFGNWVIESKHGNLKGVNELSGDKITTSLEEIQRAISNPVRLDMILKIKDDKEFNAKRKEYDRQKVINPITKIVNFYKKDFMQ